MELTDSQRASDGPSAGRPAFQRPPVLFGAAIVIGVLLERLWPMPIVARRPLGVALSVAGIALFVAAVRAFNAAGTPVPGHRPSSTLVRTGPFRFSRNPIYVAFVLIQLGLAAATGSGWLVVTLLVGVGVVATVVVPREERYLEVRFGSAYRAYRASVRRWL